jgi:hypothetical protein
MGAEGGFLVGRGPPRIWEFFTTALLPLVFRKKLLAPNLLFRISLIFLLLRIAYLVFFSESMHEVCPPSIFSCVRHWSELRGMVN